MTTTPFETNHDQAEPVPASARAPQLTAVPQLRVAPFARSVRRVDSRAPLPLRDDVTLVTDMRDLMWSVVTRDPRTGEREVLGMVTRWGTGYEVTVLADPIRIVLVTSLDEAIALTTNTRPNQGAVRRLA
jgi:hypothetical protein